MSTLNRLADIVIIANSKFFCYNDQRDDQRVCALWKALILVSGSANSSNTDKQAWLGVISEVMKDHRQEK